MNNLRHTKQATPGRHHGVIAGIATTCACYALQSTSVLAFDIDGTNNLITETIANRERLKDYDNIKIYGAERVSDRDRIYAKPDGLRVNNYLVYPSIGTTVVYDDNIFHSNTDKVADWRSEITPGIKLHSQFQRHVLDFSLDGKIVNYLENTKQDYANVQAKLDGALHFDHAHTLSLAVLSGIDHEERGELSTPLAAAEPIEVYHNRASVGITRDVGRLYGTLMATFERWDYSSVRAINGETLDQSYRDTDQFSTALRFGYRFSPGFDFVGKITAVRDFNRGDELFDRDAKGYEAMAGLAFETSPLLRWRILGGYGFRNYQQSDIADVATGLLEAQVQWLPTEYLTFTGTASREIIAANAVENAGRIESRFSGKLDYEIWHNVVMNFSVHYSDAEYVGIARRDTTLSGRVGIDYFMNKNWLLSLGYEHTVRESTDSAYDMTRNRFMISAKMMF